MTTLSAEVTGTSYRNPWDSMGEQLTGLVLGGTIEVIDPDILRGPNGLIDFRKGDSFRIVEDGQGGYVRAWPSREASERDEARRILGIKEER